MRPLAVVLGAALAGPLAYDLLRWRSVSDEIATAARLEVAVSQPDIHQGLKWESGSIPEIFSRLNRLIDEADRTVLDRHDKQHLVAVTERIPFSAVFGFLLPFMNKQFGRFVPARDLHLLDLPDTDPPALAGVLICYESLFPALVRKLRGMGADVLVNITNDAWFGRTGFPYQHAGICALRAIETRTSIIRAANTGVSALYDPLGRCLTPTPIFEEAVLAGSVPLAGRATLYAKIGDVALWLSYGGAAILLALAWRRHRASSQPARLLAAPSEGSATTGARTRPGAGGAIIHRR